VGLGADPHARSRAWSILLGLGGDQDPGGAAETRQCELFEAGACQLSPKEALQAGRGQP